MSAEIDRAYLQVALDELETYLLSNELYWQLSTRNNALPRLTIGQLLLTRLRLSARGLLSPADESRWTSVRQRWRAAWEKKASHEFNSRLNLWKNYLEDYFESPSNYAADYPGEVRQRVILELLTQEISAPLPQAAMLTVLDERLRTVLIPGPFVWEEELGAVFPKETWWYLYGRLKT
uniref:Uncharacterized protein n=1 Tax=uncultured Chloroflexota bacterium TaxID=166587 RepID=H5SLA9_9CHLR|nr:hypothetical protein HGMM_F45G04C18 [uncultured Chloroflexota bacterium]